MTPAEKLSVQKPKKSKSKRNQPWVCLLGEKRIALRLTMREVADACDLTSAAVCEIEHGSDPMLTNARRLAKFFGVTVEELWPQLR